MNAIFLMPLLWAPPEERVLTPIEPAKLERKEPIDYQKDVAPILQAKCNTCHSGWVAQGMYYTTNHSLLLKGGKRGVAVVPKKPEQSNLYLFVSHSKKPQMPPESEGDDLTPKQVAILKRWIEEGAVGPKEPEVKVRRPVSLSPALVKPIRALAMHPKSNVLAVGRGNQLFLVDAKTGEMLSTLVDDTLKSADGKSINAAHISLVESLAFSPDGATLASGSFREVTLWNIEKKTIMARLGGFADKVTALAWSPDGSRLATAGGAPTEDGEIRIFDSAGKHLLDFKNPHSDAVLGIAINADSTRLVSGSADKFVRVFDLATGKLLKSFEGHTHHVLDVGWANNQRFVSAGADDSIRIWDFDKGERVRELRGTAKQATRLAFIGKTPSFLSVGGDGVLRRWNAETGDPGRPMTDAKDFLYAVAANADGSLFASGGEEGIVRIYDGKAGQMLKAILPK